jgi:ABC-type transport system involved in cytochrome bd biosynthesis fused ATPase/permease subunit
VRGLPTLRAFNRGAAQAKRIAEVSDEYRRATMATLRVSFLSGAVLDLAATLGVALIAVTVGVRLVEGDLGLEAGLTVLLLAPELYAPLRALGAQYHASADGMAVADRILALLDEPAAVTASGDGTAPDLRAVPLRLCDVTYAYPSRPGDVLRGVDLELRPGERVAVVGRSGEGKSTIAALLLRLADPASGQVLGGDVDARAADADAWRAQLAWVPQRPTILRGTVEDNIRLGVPELGDEAVRRAARAAGADGFVRALPDGYATVVGEGGRALSAGQVQRIALARALARDAAVLVLDEPTANLDPESAALVAEAIRRLPRDRTVLLIAHDRSLTRGMDRTVELRDGRLHEEVAAR